MPCSPAPRIVSVLSSYSPQRVVRALWQHRDLIVQLTLREVTQRYKGTFLGLLWSFLTPVLMLGIYTFIFSIIFQAKWGDASGTTDVGQFALTLFAGLIPFNLFAEVITRAPSLVLQVPNYVKRVVFPLEILVIVALGAALIHALISIGILLLGTLLYMGFIAPTVLLLPVVLLPLLLLSLGLGWLLASLGVYVRDIGHTVALVVQILFYVSPIFYPITAVPPQFRFMLHLNPLTVILDSFRRILLWQQSVELQPFLLWTLMTTVVALLGYVWFMKTKHGFADVM